MSRGTPEEEHARFPIYIYIYNDIDSLAAAAEAVSGDLAGIVVSAFKHDAGYHQELPDPAFARTARAICDAEGAALILDDVRAGMRLSLDASWSLLGIQPDLSAWGKAIPNGEPLSAILGSEPYREAAESIFVTGSLWYQATPLAAAIETLDLLAEVDAPALMERMGGLFRDGLAEQSTGYGHALRQSGPPQMPTVMFEDDPKGEKGMAFCTHVLKNGVYLHPWHNMFLSIAHTEADIEQALTATARAFQALGQLKIARLPTLMGREGRDATLE